MTRNLDNVDQEKKAHLLEIMDDNGRTAGFSIEKTVLVILGTWQLFFDVWKSQRWITETSTTWMTAATHIVGVQSSMIWMDVHCVVTPFLKSSAGQCLRRCAGLI